MSNIKGTYSSTKHFFVKDSIGVPHPYCITPRYIAEAADHYGGLLGVEAITSAEKRGVRCGMKGCNLSYEQHEQALLIECLADPQVEPHKSELKKYLMSIVGETERNKNET